MAPATRPAGLLPRVVGLLVLALAALPLAADGWHSVPLFGADVRSLAFDPAAPERVLAGTSSGQVYESGDLGASWRPAGARVALPGWVVSSLKFDPHREGRVWASLWALWGADGAVAMSDDGGRTWQMRHDGLPPRQVYDLALAPDRAGELFAATREGVWRTRDSGRTWAHLTAFEPAIGKVTTLLVDPHDPDVLYAGTWRRAYRSDDRGRSWHGIFGGMALDSEVFSLRPGVNEGELWASTCGWVYNARDRGRRWQRHTDGLDERRTPSFEVLPTGALLAGTIAGVYRSDDQGASWERRSPVLAVATMAVHPSRPDVVLVGSEGSGVWRSLDGGNSFESSALGMVGVRVTDVVAALDGLALSVRHTEHSDGVHQLVGARLTLDRDSHLPMVLDLAADGAVIYAATEAGLWRRAAEVWDRVARFGTGRIENVTSADGWVVAQSRTEIVSLRHGEVDRLPVSAPVSAPVPWRGAVWLADGGELWRWDLSQRSAVSIPGAVRSLEVFGDALIVDTTAGRLRRTPIGGWQSLAVAAPRVLPTGDGTLPILALWDGGTATLHDLAGRERSAIRLPVPMRDVAATLLRDGRLHLATSGYGLLWSTVLELAQDSEPGVSISSR
ncbi:MAG: hypothetical protein O7A04_12785 [Acidobacteria bacterium]|nr:hypothetical protein [Acidobacteriota bacterium]